MATPFKDDFSCCNKHQTQIKILARDLIRQSHNHYFFRDFLCFFVVKNWLVGFIPSRGYHLRTVLMRVLLKCLLYSPGAICCCKAGISSAALPWKGARKT